MIKKPMTLAAAHALLDAIRAGLGADIPRADIDRALELTGDLAEPLPALGAHWCGLGARSPA
jgi:hypothetical protein